MVARAPRVEPPPQIPDAYNGIGLVERDGATYRDLGEREQDADDAQATEDDVRAMMWGCDRG